MIVTSTPTQTDIYTALRTVLLEIIENVEVIQGEGNRVPTPLGEFIVIQAISQTRLTNDNINKYSDPFPLDGSKLITSKIQYAVQIDCFGANSSNNANKIVALLRDDFGISLLQCLYCSEPTQAPLTSGEETYIQRWMITAEMQVNFDIGIKQEFFDKAGTIDLIEVDTHFPAT